MDLETTPQKRPGLTENLTGQELFIYDAGGQELTVLNRTALLIWSLCDGSHPVAEMIPVLAAIHPDAPPDRLREDLLACLTSFAESGLLAGPAGEST